ncbi:hypothetical protein TNIN_463041 [Trichonephila inaurata madagascariensis]|uniref:TAZ-type domain-containing protein n=1 Tax=Trichonephila inaurata madagascariensis TaxID=2747483 RepID=A0A8X6Y5X7_9ARAC|nr:hypothetical protein TNIN_463041 [Trichonephila inaurata madagascariensis]
MKVPPSDTFQKYSISWNGVRHDFCDPIYFLEHASRCVDLSCKNLMCIKLKASFRHFKECLEFGACEECEYFYEIAFRHASNCEKEWCPTFMCVKIRQVLKQCFHERKKV